MGILTIEDLKGKTEVTLAPKELDEYRGLVKPDAIVFVRGTVSRKREEPSVRAVEVITAERAPEELSTCVVLRLSESIDDERTLERVFDTCRRHPGKRPVFLEIKSAADQIAVVRCGSAVMVNCSSECLRDLAGVVGAERVICTGATRRPIPWTNVCSQAKLKSASPVPIEALA
jgi:DNA polymerase III alpha subunit